LVRSAGTIFSGEVTSVRLLPATQAGTVPTVEVHFRVEHGFRGAHAGQDLVIREWQGLWTTGPHYRAGERVLLFLYAPSRAGLTSPVAGGQGRFAVDDAGRIVVPQGGPAPVLSGSAGPRQSQHVPYRDFASALRLAGRQEVLR
jgi:hypothetical protein